MSIIRTQGIGRVAVVPDEAQLRIAMSELASERAQALDSVAKHAKRVVEFADSAGIEPAEQRLGPVLLQPQDEWIDERRQRVGYLASAEFTATLRDAAVANQLVADIAAALPVDIQGPTWTVTAEHPARTESRRRAAIDARARALTYAEALGLRLGELTELSESEIPIVAPSEPRFAKMAMAMEVAPMPEATGEMVVETRVYATFATLP